MSLIIVATGNVSREPETKEVNGTSLATFGIASNEFIKGEQRASFITVNAWGQQAEFCGRNFKKGSFVEIVGVLQEERWEDKESGAKRSKHVIRATTVGFGSAPKKKEEPAADEGEQEAPAPKKPVTTVKKPVAPVKTVAKPAPKKPAPVLETEVDPEFDANLGDIDIPGEGDE